MSRILYGHPSAVAYNFRDEFRHLAWQILRMKPPAWAGPVHARMPRDSPRGGPRCDAILREVLSQNTPLNCNVDLA